MANPNPPLDQPDPWELDRATCEAVHELTARLTRTVTDREAGESFTECLACGEVDSHGESCIVPVLEAWLTGDTPTIRLSKGRLDVERNIRVLCRSAVTLPVVIDERRSGCAVYVAASAFGPPIADRTLVEIAKALKVTP